MQILTRTLTLTPVRSLDQRSKIVLTLTPTLKILLIPTLTPTLTRTLTLIADLRGV